MSFRRLGLRLSPFIGLLALAGPGCKGKEKDKAVESGARALAGLDAMPDSVDQVVGLDVARLAHAPLVERAVETLLAGDPELASDLRGLLDGCNIDVERDIHRLWLGMDRDAGDQAILVVDGALGEGQLGTCVGKAVGPSGGRLSGERVGGRTHYHMDQAEGRPDVWFAVVGTGAVVVATSAELLAAAAGDGPKLGGKPALAELIARAGTGHAVWFAGSVPPEVGHGLTKVGASLGTPKAMFGHLNLDGALDAELGVVMGSAAEASEAATMVKAHLATLSLIAQADQLGRVVHQVAAAAAGDTLRFTLALPEGQVRALVGTTIDSAPPDAQNAPPSEQQGVERDGQGDPAPGGEAPVRK